MKDVLTLLGVFAFLSLLSVGGGMAVFPELKYLTVEKYDWLTIPELVHLFGVGQAAPGPNMMVVAAIGAHVAGPPGAMAALVAFLTPTALLTFGVGRLWVRLEKWPWRDAIQRGLAPVSVGLVLAGSISLARGALTGWLTISIAVAVLATMLLTRINPALLVLGGALIGLIAYWPV